MLTFVFIFHEFMCHEIALQLNGKVKFYKANISNSYLSMLYARGPTVLTMNLNYRLSTVQSASPD